MPNTASEEATPFHQESRSQVSKERGRGRATQANYRNKRDEDSKPGMSKVYKV